MGTSIVVADDEDELRAIYSEVLRRKGYEVHEAADGQKAIELIITHHPALLILDVWMPVINGFEVLDRLRDEPSALGLKVVMLSNLGDSDSKLESFSAGVIDFWDKSISLEELCASVAELLVESTASQEPI